MSAHTKGPWQVGRKGEYSDATFHVSTVFAMQGEVGVCEIHGFPLQATLEDVQSNPRYSVPLANGRLLAAAPDLLSALQGMVATLENVASQHPDELWLGSEYQDALVALRRAQ